MSAPHFNEAERIGAALSYVPANSRDTWVRMGMAVKAELGEDGFDAWNAWSQTAADSYNESDARAVWKSIDTSGGITIATLFDEAKKGGFNPAQYKAKPVDAAERERRRAERVQRDKEAEAQRTQEATTAEARCAQMWAEATDETSSHAYVTAKGIKPVGARLRNGALLVPLRDTDGVLHSLQFIQRDGSKTFKKGGSIAGFYCAIGGKPGLSAPLLICEGWATACSLHEATGYPVAAAMNAGNLLAVAQALRAKLGDVPMIICADDDIGTNGNPGLSKAMEAALAADALLVAPNFGPERPNGATDFNDLHMARGLDAVRNCIEEAMIKAASAAAASATANPPAEDPLPASPRAMLTCAANVTPEAITWLWPQWLPAGKLSILAGSPGTGKTTIALSLAATVSAGGTWPDGSRMRRPGRVLMWSSEDDPADTLVPRLMACGANLKNIFFAQKVSDENGELMPFDPSQHMPLLGERLHEMGGADLLIVDPIVSAVTGDAHRVNDVRRNLQGLVDMAAAHRCAVLGISHFAKGSRGTSPAERVIGSQAFVALARMVLVAAKDEAAERRVFARAKSNISADDGGIAYAIEQTEATTGINASRIIWGDQIEGAAREILGDVERDDNEDERSLKDSAKDFLSALLADGPVNAKELKKDADGAGYSWPTIHRAATDLGVEKRKIGMKEGWVWALPKMPRAERAGEDAALYLVASSPGSAQGGSPKISAPEDFTKISALPHVKSSGGGEIFRNYNGLRGAENVTCPEDFKREGVKSSVKSSQGSPEDSPKGTWHEDRQSDGEDEGRHSPSVGGLRDGATPPEEFSGASASEKTPSESEGNPSVPGEAGADEPPGEDI
ncbi:AAA family ATPase [Ralstonia chuxiongensis]|uniref:AAA family ATPase n=1 Tax=Ralstonia chuxiongensis TaxID=2957504 RepID=UPI0028F5C0B5|nr:AAA family ATPase [Ralstonia chuxiongensis]CAJ0777718.1 hypothetical protein R8510_04401 [Ralstonia chuxiongensis]